MKRLLLLALLLFGCAGASFAQTCVQPFTAFGTGILPTVPAAGFDNRLQGCDTWFLSISVSGFSAVSVRPDAAVDTGGAAGAFQDWITAGGTMVNGSYPLTASTLTPISFAGTPAWVGVEITSATGSGIVSGVLYGYRANTAGSVTVGAVNIKDSSGNNLNSTSGALNVNVTGGSTGNGAAGNTGTTPPSQADAQGIKVGVNLQGQTGVNPSGTVYAAATDMTSVNGVTTLTGAGATGTGAQRVTVSQDTTTIAGAAPGTAGTASANVITVQGISGGTSANVAVTNTPTVTANAGTGTFNIQSNASVNHAQVNGVTVLTGAGASGTGSQRTTVAQDTTTIAGSAPGTAGTPSSNVVTVQGATSMTPLATNQTQVAGSSVATAATGIAKVGLTDGTGNALSSTTGSLNVNITGGGGSGGTSSNFGSTFPTPGTAIGAKNGANMVNLTADSSNNLNVDLAADALTSAINNPLNSGENPVFTGCQYETTPATIGTTAYKGALHCTSGQLLMAGVFNGSNQMPSMDAAARAGFQKITDGTNTMPTMDTVARAGNQKITDGTNTVAVLASNGAAAGTNRLGTLPGIAQSNMPSAATAGRDMALRTDLQGNLLVAPVHQTSMTSYAASKVGLVPASTPTDVAVLSGNATNTVIVNRIVMTCTQTTAGLFDLRLLKRTTADSGGTSTGSPTAYAMDSNDGAAVSAVLTYTANPTVNDGTDRVIDSVKVAALAPATAGAGDIYIWQAPPDGQGLILRGTAQQAALNLNGVTLTGGSCNISYFWTETTGL